MKRNQKGFTLIEIIAVLVILGILAAVAVPKYMDLQADSKKKAASGQVAEVKGTLSSAWGKYFMRMGKAPSTVAMVRTEAGLAATGNSMGTAPDLWLVDISDAGLVTVQSRGGDAEYSATGTWNLPTSS